MESEAYWNNHAFRAANLWLQQCADVWLLHSKVFLEYKIWVKHLWTCVKLNLIWPGEILSLYAYLRVYVWCILMRFAEISCEWASVLVSTNAVFSLQAGMKGSACEMGHEAGSLHRTRWSWSTCTCAHAICAFVTAYSWPHKHCLSSSNLARAMPK